MTDWRAVGERVKQLRTAQGLTQGALGDRVGTSNTDVSQVEAGARLSEEKLARYAEGLGVSVAYLRYGIVSSGLDREQIWRDGYEAGWRRAVARVRESLTRVEVPELADDEVPLEWESSEQIAPTVTSTDAVSDATDDTAEPPAAAAPSPRRRGRKR